MTETSHAAVTAPVTRSVRPPHPVRDDARARLRDAQKAEADALREVTAAEKVRDRARRALARAEQSLATAQAGLVKVSGADRAALLIDEPVGVLRTRLRQAGAAASRPSEHRGHAVATSSDSPDAARYSVRS
jgi:hypothetical protein